MPLRSSEENALFFQTRTGQRTGGSGTWKQKH